MTALRVVFKFAAQHRPPYIPTNPVNALNDSELPDPEADRRETQVLDESELERLFRALPDPLILQVKACLGLRSSELRGLVWGDIDFGRKRVRISRQLNDRGERVALKDRALAESRYVPLTERALAALRDRHAVASERDLANPQDFVFSDLGKPITDGQLYVWFKDAVRDAKIVKDPDKKLTPHSLRHGFGSLLLGHGEDLANVSRWLGHRRVSTTEKWYVHQIESLDDLAAERMRQREVNRAVNRDPSPGFPSVPVTTPEAA